MWTYFISVYYLQNRDENGRLNDEAFCAFLSKTIAFVWAYAVYMPGVNALRTPIFNEMVNIVNNKDVDFAGYKFDLTQLKSMFNNYEFKNNRPITKSMLAWWAFENNAQELLEIDKVFEIEHIYAKNRYEKEKSLDDGKIVEKLGNKSLLEKRINIRASDYRFVDKKKYYSGYTLANGKVKEETEIVSLRDLVSKEDFTQQDIIDRHDAIIDEFMNYLKLNNLSVN